LNGIGRQYDTTGSSSFLPERRSKRGICYGDVACWVAGCLSKRLNLS